VGRWEEQSGWRRLVGGSTLPVDTTDQAVVCLEGQTDGHSISDHNPSRCSVEQLGIPSHPINTSQ